MTRLQILLSKLTGLFRKGRLEQELDRNVRAHLQMLTEENQRKGMEPEEARYAAMRQFGNVSRMKEECRERWSIRLIEELLQDVRYGLRQLRRNPGFTAVAVLTLALGIGANTAIFSVVNNVLLRPLPYKDPGRLVMANESFGSAPVSMVVGPDFLAWKNHNRVFKQVEAFGGAPGNNLTGLGKPARVTAVSVTVGFFHMLGVHPVFGRTFAADEGSQGKNHVALISENFWRSRLGASRKVLGSTIHLDNVPYTVVGVIPAYLRYPAADVWTPLSLDSRAFSVNSPGASLTVIGRLNASATPRQAQSDLQLISEQMTAQYSPRVARFHAQVEVHIVPLHELFVRHIQLLLLILQGAVALVLLIACANVSNLLLSRAVARDRELAVRAALGAERARLIRQLLTESMMLAASGGVFGFFAGLWAVRLLKRLVPPTLPSGTSLDPRVFAFVAGIALLAVPLLGLVPALTASQPGALKAQKTARVRAGTGAGVHRLRNSLLVGEVGLSLVLLIGAGLLTRSFVRLSDVHLGFDPNNLLTAQVWQPMASNFNASSPASSFREMLNRIQALQGVKAAAVTTHTPVSSFGQAQMGLHVHGGTTIPGAQAIFLTSISPGYFHTMGIRLLKGRFFDGHDTDGATPVAILDETLAQMAFNGHNPLGHRIRAGGPNGRWLTVVGVVADNRNSTLEQSPWPEIFVPYTQMCPHFATFVLRTTGDPLALAGAVQRAVQSVDKNQPVSNIESMDEVIARGSAPQRFRMLLFGLFALLAMALAAVGIFGLTTYSVSQRTHEIGIRMALGAERGDVLRMVIGHGLKLALIGVAIGIAGALALTRFLSSLLYGVKPTDPVTFIAVSLILIAVALVACYIPARRAAKVDPMVALRYE